MIRRSLASAVLGLSLLCAAPAFAQAPAIAPTHLQAAREIMDITGVTSSIEGIYRQFEENTQQLLTTRPEAVKDAKAVIEELRPEAQKRSDEMIRNAAEIFAKKLTEADLKEAATFFKSPVGQRYLKLRSDAMNEVFDLMQPWSVQTSNYLFDRFSQEMRKRGHQL